MPINAGYEYFDKEKEYLNANNVEDRIYWLEEMIKAAPKHKSSENFIAELKTRLKKLREKAEKLGKKKSGKRGIRKEGFQFVLIGLTNRGKSSLLRRLTNAKPLIADYSYTTFQPELGTFVYEGIKAQIVDVPSIGSENFDVGIVNNADCLILVVEDLSELNEVEKATSRSRAKKIVIVNKIDLLNETEKRKLTDRIKSRRISGFIVSCKTGEGIEALKSEMFSLTGMIRIYLKEPGKPVKDVPLVLKNGTSLREVAEGIYKGFSKTVKEIRLTGPSSKFPNQRVGLTHIVKDKDIVEFHTR